MTTKKTLQIFLNLVDDEQNKYLYNMCKESTKVYNHYIFCTNVYYLYKKMYSRICINNSKIKN